MTAPTPFDLGVEGDIVSLALADLSHFGPLDREVAGELLDLWVERDRLTDDQRAEVLAYYQEMAP